MPATRLLSHGLPLRAVHQRCCSSRRYASTVAAASTTKSQRIGFIGLGNMGNHMAFNLVKAGHELVVYDIAQKSIDHLQHRVTDLSSSHSHKVEVVKHYSHIPAAQVDTIVTMLPSSPHVREVYTSAEGLLPAAKKHYNNNKPSTPLLLIDSSTIDPLTSSEVATEAHNTGVCAMVDAPVSGGIGGAEAGTLTFMVGGNDSDFQRAKLVLQHMGKNIVHCGAAGTGQTAKVCNNLCLGIQMVAVAEAMNLGIKLGMDAKKLAAIFNSSTARCWSSDTYNPVPDVLPNVPSSRQYQGGFGTALMKKDLGLALTAAQPLGVPLHLGELANKLYSEVVDSGNGGKDFGYIYQHLKQLSGK